MNLLIINRLKKQFNNNEIFKNYLSITILFTYCYFWISIGKFVEVNFNKFFNNGLIYLTIFFVCLFISIIKLINSRKLPIISILLIYPVASSIGYFNNINFHQSFELLIHFFLTIFTLFIFFSILEDYKDKKKLFKYFFKISLIFIFLVFIILVFPDLTKRIVNNIHVREIYLVTLNLFFIDYTYIQNSNGASRIAVLIFIFFFTKFIFKIKKNKDYKKYFLFSILFSIIIFYYQSRLSILFVVLYVLFWILTFSNKKIFLKIVFFISIVIVPFAIQYIYNSNLLEKLEKTPRDIILQKDQKDKGNIFSFWLPMSVKSRIFGSNLKHTGDLFNAGGSPEICSFTTNFKAFEILDIYSSGRVCGWEILLKNMGKEDIIFGKGFFYDQIYLKKYQKISSNSYINIIYNSGLIGFFPILFIFIILMRKYQIIYKLYIKSDYQDFLIFNLMLFLLIRSFFEDTFAFVSIDLILFLTCFVTLSSKIKEFENYNKLNDFK